MKLHLTLFILATSGCSVAAYFFGYKMGAADGAKYAVQTFASDSISHMNKHILILEAFQQDRLDLAKEGIELLVKNDNEHRKKIESIIAVQRSFDFCKL